MTPTRKEITETGLYLKTEFGACKFFEWRVYEFKNERYRVSMFSDEIEHIGRTYCDLCGKPTYENFCCGHSLENLQV